MAKRFFMVVLLAPMLMFAHPRPASAHVNFAFSFGVPFFGGVVASPGFYGTPLYPAPLYAPPVYYAPPAYYAPAPVFAPPVVIGGGFFGPRFHRGFVGFHGGFGRGLHGGFGHGFHGGRAAFRGPGGRHFGRW